MVVEHESVPSNSCNHVLKPLGKKRNDENAILALKDKNKLWEQEEGWTQGEEWKMKEMTANKIKKGTQKNKNKKKN